MKLHPIPVILRAPLDRWNSLRIASGAARIHLRDIWERMDIFIPGLDGRNHHLKGKEVSQDTRYFTTSQSAVPKIARGLGRDRRGHEPRVKLVELYTAVPIDINEPVFFYVNSRSRTIEVRDRLGCLASSKHNSLTRRRRPPRGWCTRSWLCGAGRGTPPC